MQDKKFFYSYARIFGAAIFILLSLITGPLVGYFTGDYLVRTFFLPASILFICLGLGFLSSILEVVRIAKFLVKKETR